MENLFLTFDGRPFTQRQFGHMLTKLGDAAGIKKGPPQPLSAYRGSPVPEEWGKYLCLAETAGSRNARDGAAIRRVGFGRCGRCSPKSQPSRWVAALTRCCTIDITDRTYAVSGRMGCFGGRSPPKHPHIPLELRNF